MSVSYTHLDVYKRQVCVCVCVCVGGVFLIPAIPLLGLCIAQKCVCVVWWVLIRNAEMQKSVDSLKLKMWSPNRCDVCNQEN